MYVRKCVDLFAQTSLLCFSLLVFIFFPVQMMNMDSPCGKEKRTWFLSECVQNLWDCLLILQVEGMQDMAAMAATVPVVEQREEPYDPLHIPDVDKSVSPTIFYAFLIVNWFDLFYVYTCHIFTGWTLLTWPSMEAQWWVDHYGWERRHSRSKFSLASDI